MSDTLIYISNVNTPEFLERALDSIKEHLSSVVLLDCSERPHIPTAPVGHYVRVLPIPNFTQGQNWAQSLARAQGKRFLVYMHADAISREGALDKALDWMRKAPHHVGAAFVGTYDPIIVFRMNALDHVGPWDEDFTWYESDIDYYHRIRMAGYSIATLNLHVEHGGSRTFAESTPERRKELVEQEIAAKRLYLEKWGGPRGEERFVIPYQGRSEPSDVGTR